MEAWSLSIHNHTSFIPYKKSTLIIHEAKTPSEGNRPHGQSEMPLLHHYYRIMMETMRFKILNLSHT
jgi:hypothetical protein